MSSILLDPRWTVAVAAIALGMQYLRKSTRPPLPPGPRGLPVVGNIFDVPSGDIWIQLAKLGDIWGEISSLTVFGQTTVIVNSLQVAEDLLDVQGANFSERPVIPMGGELVGFNNALSLSQYGERVRTERKLFHRVFGSHAAISPLVPLISSEIQKLLRNLIRHPTEAADEIRRTLGAITLRIAYGYQLIDGPEEDPYLTRFETAANDFAETTVFAAFLVDIIPALRYWPEWLPGGRFHTTAKILGKRLNDTVDAGLQYVKEQAATGSGESSFASGLLEEGVHDDYLIKWAAISIQAAGSDTTASQLEAFLLAMILYPEVQLAAQKELDAVIGNDRLPELSDRTQLPYVDALCKEVLRWHVVTPIGIPHRTREDFIYDRGGEFTPLLIPKNSVVIANLWHMTHDPDRYIDPMVFDPSRFIATATKSAEPDPTRMSFGFGRRICPGKLLADTTLFMACSAILAVFRILPTYENGKVVHPRVGQTTGTVSHTLPFTCALEPRNSRAQDLITGGGGL